MKKDYFILAILILILSITSCSKEDNKADLNVSIKKISFSVSPQSISKNDLVIIIDSTCSYNVLQELSVQNREIRIVRTFNSSMMWPCVIKVDSLILGYLDNGDYIVNYTLKDIRTAYPGPSSETKRLYFKVK